MKAPADASRAKASRLRGRGQWALVVGIIGLLACAAGAVQYRMTGIVSIRPGHEPLSGAAAVEMLLFLLGVSAAFTVFGYLMLRRARRQRDGRRSP